MEDGVIARKELIECGFTPSEIEGRVARGSLIRLRRGYYSVGAGDESAHRSALRAAVDASGANAVVACWSAAMLHELPVVPGALERVWMTSLKGAHGRRNPVRHSRLCRGEDDEVVGIGGFPTTSLARTVADLARTTSLEWGVAVADAALARGAERAGLNAAINRWPRRPGNVKARQVVDWADPLSESVGESRSRVIMRRYGVPQPVLQYRVMDGTRLIGIADFAWPQFRTIGEFDGKVKYLGVFNDGEAPADVIMREKRREEGFRAQGWWLVRWDASVLAQPRQLAARIRTALDFGIRD